MPRLIPIDGQRSGFLVVIERGAKNNGRNKWKCLCDCGNVHFVRGQHLRQGRTVSCGCHNGRVMAARLTTHGESRKGAVSTKFMTWMNMRSRCENTKNNRFANYGGRGIKVCDRWQSFDNFLSDMGRRPPGSSLDRIDNDAGYEPDNCRWATRKEQARNTSRNRIITWNGVSLLLCEWEEMVGIPASVIKKRIDVRGWSLTRALTMPNRATKKTPCSQDGTCELCSLPEVLT